MAAKLLLLAALMMVPSVAGLEDGGAPTAAAKAAAWAKSPLKKVVDMLGVLSANIKNEGTAEQAAYDKYSCWVESTLQSKSKDISDAKALIDSLGDEILGLKASTATLTAEIKGLNTDISANIASNKEATAIRDKERTAFASAKLESESSITALTGAIKTLKGAGTFMGLRATGSKKKLHDVELLSAATGLRELLQSSRIQSKLSEDQMEVVKQFVQSPQEASSSQGIIATQTGNNPAGDYAPASAQIQGIVKDMLDSTTADLKSDIADEASTEKTHKALIAGKNAELATLQASVLATTSNSKQQEKSLADKDILRDNTATLLETDEAFFADTTEAAKQKATEWSTRVRLRTEEMAGMQGAIDVLSKSSQTFGEASISLLQRKGAIERAQSREQAINHVSFLASKYQSASLEKVVALMKSSGAFDSVIGNVDKMMALLRQEEKDDIAHRDRCEEKENDNANDIADATAGADAASSTLRRLGNTGKTLAESVVAAEAKIKAAKQNMKELTALRLTDQTNFKQAAKVDSQSISTIAQATAVLSKFYASQKVGLGLLQAKPKAEFAGADEHQGEATNIVAILNMMQEDFQKEMKEGRADEASAQAEYVKQKAALQDTIDAQTETKVSLEKEQASNKDEVTREAKVKREEQTDLEAANARKKAIEGDCSWVKTKFTSRRTKRKTEMDGLVDAKDFLAGVTEGRPVLAMLAK